MFAMCNILEVKDGNAIKKQSPLMGRGLILTNYKPKL
jgi:hypothetical protein